MEVPFKTNISKFQFDQESGRWRTTKWMSPHLTSPHLTSQSLMARKAFTGPTPPPQLISLSRNSVHVLSWSPSCFCPYLFNRLPSAGFWCSVHTFQFPIFFYPSTCSAWVALSEVKDSSLHSSMGHWDTNHSTTVRWWCFQFGVD